VVGWLPLPWGWLARALGVRQAHAPTLGHLALGLPALALGQARALGGAGFPYPGQEPGLRPHVGTLGAWLHAIVLGQA